jgi:proteasome accessory factor B
VARNVQLVRLQRILQILEQARFGKTERELHRELLDDWLLQGDLGAWFSLKTVKRDLSALVRSGYDLRQEKTPGDGVRWKAGPNLRNKAKIHLTLSELLAFSVGRDLLLPLAGTEYHQAIESLWYKMRETLSEEILQDFEKHRRQLVVRGVAPKNYDRKRGILANLRRAIRLRHAVRVEYRSARDSATALREIEPYRVFYWNGSLYVVAVQVGVPEPDPYRTFKLDRLTRAEVLERTFTPRADFDAERHFENSFGVFRSRETATMRVRFCAKLATWATETPFHPKQVVEHLPDGSVEVWIESAYVEEVLPRLLSAGADAELLEPAHCRERLAAMLQAILKRYQPGEAGEAKS